MGHHMKRNRKSLGVSVVTVLSAFTPVAGCEDEPTGPALDASGGNSEAGMNCPALVPKEGDRCVAGATCGYEVCGIVGGLPTRQAICEQGVFKIRLSSCNPPWPWDGGSTGDASQQSTSLDSGRLDGG